MIPSSECDNEVAKANEIISVLSGLIKTIEGDQNTSESLLARGKIREISQNFQAASLFYGEAFRKDPKNYEALARLSLSKLKTGSVHDGLSFARELVDKDHNFQFKTITGQPVSSFTVLGDALRLNSEALKADEAYTASIKLTNGQDSYSVLRAANIKVEEGDIDGASALIQPLAASNDEFSGIKSAIDLLQNDRQQLPALKGMISNAASLVAAGVAV